ncbi:hypothetical protein FRACYDRAFT_234589 [Fragilariopsis cylindrus CCMP1102]|uniref:Uncharacterized protein n=1 Tax=Fragilariopsis cylindrus CCMP1102 TaxID=635003 RepID=A0A1E7FS39_9STRA|nr:hypothetical protein FRACYDRAFT_234589 [Fragilariopsis cylindrus CCMP1102]|eukprot:OEU20958.1 hypothetical protein FRACYDRAFT_234589 [Fragilariopsis cylindrus CCMP1102]
MVISTAKKKARAAKMKGRITEKKRRSDTGTDDDEYDNQTRGQRFRSRSLYHDIRPDKTKVSQVAVARRDEPYVQTDDDSKYWTKKSSPCKAKSHSNDGKSAGKAGGKSGGKAGGKSGDQASISMRPSISGRPSYYPTSQPSTPPTKRPSSRPSDIPSVSFEPTIAIFKTTQDSSSGWESTCTASQPSNQDGEDLKEQRLVFRYRLFVPEDNPVTENTITDMEGRVHEGLSRHFLECKEVGRDSDIFSIWSISSDPLDIIYSNTCDLPDDYSPPEKSTCVLMQADLGMYVYFPPSRRNRHLNNEKERALKPSPATDADQQVIEKTGEYLIAAMEGGDFNDDEIVLQTEFVGFIMEEDLHGTLNGGGSNTAAAAQQSQTKQTDSKVVAGTTLMAAAAVCLIAVTIISLHRRKRRSDAYLKHIDDNSIFSDKDDADRLTCIVDDNDSLDWMHEYGHNGTNGDGMENTAYHHDVHRCTSSYCEVCRHHKNTYPTFIASKVASSNLDDLRCGPSIIEDNRSYSSPDTVDL